MALTRQPAGATAPRPAWPDLPAERVALAYEGWPIDTLYVDLGGLADDGAYEPVAAGERPVDGLAIKVSLDGRRVLGFLVEGYLADGLSRPTAWLAVAPLAGIPETTLRAFGVEPGPADADPRAALAELLAEVRDAWEATSR